MTMAFVTLALSQLFHSFNVKSEHSIFSKQIFSNKYLWGAFAVGVGLQLLVMYVPFLASAFSMAALDPSHLMIAVGPVSYTHLDVYKRQDDDIFNEYIRKVNTVNPYYAEYCDGRQVWCKGLKQWGTVDQANKGLNAFEILQYYYGDDIELIDTSRIEGDVYKRQVRRLSL